MTPTPLQCPEQWWLQSPWASESSPSSMSADAQRIRASYSDSVAVAMEDVGVTRAADLAGAKGLAIRAVSDLLDGKAEADASGSKLIAADNAAAFAFELLASLQFSAPADASLDDIVGDPCSQDPD